jgi:urea transport system substrate-binding protein
LSSRAAAERRGDGGGAQRLRDELVVALVVPLQGPAGIFGPSCELCAELAVLELNAGAGVLGRPLRLHVVDGGAGPARVTAEVEALVAAGAVDAVVGWHISAVRQALAPRLSGRVPYVYTALYEGGECAPGVFLTGETPAGQVLPALHWLAQELGARRWVVVGNDYVWPRASAAAVRAFAAEGAITVVAEQFVPLGCEDFSEVLSHIGHLDSDGVLLLLVGQDAVRFNRDFVRAGLQGLVRLSPLMDENMLLATGAASTGDLYAAAGYFESLPTGSNLDFSSRFSHAFGTEAPVLNSLGESCYEGITLLAQLAAQAGSLEVHALQAAAPDVRYESPRGRVRLRDRHVQQDVYLARARGLDFDVLCTLPPADRPG